jgi:hypothetical protein
MRNVASSQSQNTGGTCVEPLWLAKHTWVRNIARRNHDILARSAGAGNHSFQINKVILAGTATQLFKRGRWQDIEAGCFTTPWKKNKHG